MVIKAPEQQLYDAMFITSQNMGYDTYQEKPQEATYPFVELDYVQMVPRATKSQILGTVHMQINVWGLRNDRKTVSDMTFNMFRAARFLKMTGSENWRMDIERSDYQILKVTTEANEKLYRGQIEIAMNIN